MKKIISQRRYNTDGATLIGKYDNHVSPRDIDYFEERLYRKINGEFFIHGIGGAATRYASSDGDNHWTAGEKLVPISTVEAMDWVEAHLTAEDYERTFGAIEDGEDGAMVKVSIRIPIASAERLRRRAMGDGTTTQQLLYDLLKSAGY